MRTARISEEDGIFTVKYFLDDKWIGIGSFAVQENCLYGMATAISTWLIDGDVTGDMV